MRTSPKILLTLAVLCAVSASPLLAQLDCAALANSALAEPPGYAQQCLGMEAGNGGALSVQSPTSTGYKYDMRNNIGLYSYQVGSFPTQTFVGAPFPSGENTFAMDFDAAGTTLWAIHSTTFVLGTINTTSGVFTPVTPAVGPLPAGQSPSGLAIDPVSNTFYVSTTDVTTSTLLTLNPATGALTPVGVMTNVAGAIDISMNCDGEIYAHDLVTDSLYSINPATGAGTLVGSHGLAANFAQGMDFDNEDGTLYACIYTGGGTNTYASWDTGTGAITPLATSNPLGEWECAIPTVCPATAFPYPLTQEIPTLGTWGLAALALVLLGLATLMIRRRSA
ncbi:MAG: IPTL-CTERM sorting domain-containing protein [Acidobacteria bacterium]|nr:IPTL-CTERM sorting domain-containing protein [Acidobacteriota bacterium]MCB9377167.1 IPTL-CTERM sorting domain-containing protein [Holophagales bacterium]